MTYWWPWNNLTSPWRRHLIIGFLYSLEIVCRLYYAYVFLGFSNQSYRWAQMLKRKEVDALLRLIPTLLITCEVYRKGNTLHFWSVYHRVRAGQGLAGWISRVPDVTISVDGRMNSKPNPGDQSKLLPLRSDRSRWLFGGHFGTVGWDSSRWLPVTFELLKTTLRRGGELLVGKKMNLTWKGFKEWTLNLCIFTLWSFVRHFPRISFSP